MRKIRDILRLCYEAKLPYRVIATTLNIGYGTVVGLPQARPRSGRCLALTCGNDRTIAWHIVVSICLTTKVLSVRRARF